MNRRYVVRHRDNPDLFLGRDATHKPLTWGPLAFAYTYDDPGDAGRATKRAEFDGTVRPLTSELVPLSEVRS